MNLLPDAYRTRKLFASLVLLFFVARSCLGAESRPNVVVIMADDLGFGDLGVSGQLDRAAMGLPSIQTPNIDALAGQSLRFNNMYSTPVCASTRATLLTGFHQGHALVDDVRALGTPEIRGGNQDRTWGQVLQDDGYKTSMFGKWHLGGVVGFSSIDNFPAIPVQKGFEEVYGSLIGSYRTPSLWESDGAGSLQLSAVPSDPSWPGPGLAFQYSEDATANRIEQFIRTNANTAQPFSVYAAFNAPHTPLNQIPQGIYANENWPEGQKNYAAMITRLDQHVGQIISSLEDPNGDGNKSDSVMDNTLLVFTSDNGAHWRQGGSIDFDPVFFNSTGGYAGHKASTREGGIRVPFFVRWDGVTQPGENSDHVGTLADVMPTLAELVGKDAPIGIDGRSMLAPIKGEGPGARPDTFSWSRYQSFSVFDLHAWSVRVKDWKLVHLESSGPQLFDLSVDPFEQNNLASSRADIVNVLTSIGEAEGYNREPIEPRPDFPLVDRTLNTLFTQYKTWQPLAASTDFGAAANWAGGTQIGVPNNPEAQNWNTGPADNWLATVRNTTGGNQTVVVSANAEVLAMEVHADSGLMNLQVQSGARLTTRNGLRIGSGGRVLLEGGELNTIREIDIRAGGELVGAGMITGQQQVIAGIVEFQNQGLFEPEVINAGSIVVEGNSGAGILAIDGDFTQESTGLTHLDLIGAGGSPGFDFDQITVEGSAHLEGGFVLRIDNALTLVPGATFEVLTADSIFLDGLQLLGAQANQFSFSVVGGMSLVLEYFDADFNGDSLVNQSDLDIWQSHFGQTSSVGLGDGDANGDGEIDGWDFLAWQRGAKSSALVATSENVPEPSCLLLGCLALVTRLASHRPSKRLW